MKKVRKYDRIGNELCAFHRLDESVLNDIARLRNQSTSLIVSRLLINRSIGRCRVQHTGKIGAQSIQCQSNKHLCHFIFSLLLCQQTVSHFRYIVQQTHQ